MKDRNLPEVWEVRWEDSSGEHGWTKDKAAREVELVVITSVGFLISDDDKKVRVSSSAAHMPKEEFSWNSRFDCVTAIPRSAVRGMKRLKKARQ